MITILYDTLIIRLIKQQSIWQTCFCLKRCAPQHAVNDSKFQVHCLLLGAGGDGMEEKGEGDASCYQAQTQLKKKKPKNQRTQQISFGLIHVNEQR